MLANRVEGTVSTDSRPDAGQSMVVEMGNGATGGSNAGRITIESVTATGSTLRGTISCSRNLERFFTGRSFRTEYDRSVKDVPEAILAIPILAHVCPVAWARGAAVVAPTVDERYASALVDVCDALVEMHPRIMEGGRLYAERLAAPDPPDGDRSALLFSGGVDSLASYVRHRDEDMDLISIRGWVIDDDESEQADWERTRDELRGFAERRGHDHLPLESNMLSFLDSPMLGAHYKRYLLGDWYSSVGHGIGLLGLTAPLTYERGVTDVYMAATYPEWEVLQGGSHPTVDNNVRWTGVDCHHDAHDLGRQDKLGVIADYVRAGNPDLQIRTCTRTSTGNCSRCEKCSRTMFGLLLEGLDPNDHGFEFGPAAFDLARQNLADAAWSFGDHEIHMWEDLRSHYDGQDLPDGGEAFFRWLTAADLEAIAERSTPPLTDRLLRALARNMPAPVYARAYTMYDWLR